MPLLLLRKQNSLWWLSDDDFDLNHQRKKLINKPMFSICFLIPQHVVVIAEDLSDDRHASRRFKETIFLAFKNIHCYLLFIRDQLESCVVGRSAASVASVADPDF